MYITVPIPNRPESENTPPFKIDVTENSCSKQPFTLRVINATNRWESLVILSLSDDEFANLKAEVLEADKKRRTSKENALEALKVSLGVTDDE